MTIRNWRCLRCGYIHISDIEGNLPTRCPVCKSTRIMRTPSRETKGSKYNLSITEIYSLLYGISELQILEQEKIRKNLRESGGIHILCLDKKKGLLKEILTKNEAEQYLLLVKSQSFGLAIINHSVVAIAPDSPIRPHIGVNISLLKELIEISQRNF